MIRNKYISLLWLSFAIFTFLQAIGASPLKLSLQHAIDIANDSSLSAFRYRNLYQSGYWEFRSFKAARLPSLSLSLTPAKYYREITSRYDYENNMDVYRPQQTYAAYGGLNISQNFDLLGGTFFVESDLNFMRNMGANTYSQFSSTPFRIGYSQQLLGFNEFKWDKKIEPLKYEKVKKEFIYNMESVSESTVEYFFALVLAQSQLQLAQESLASADTLYTIGERRFKIAAISQADLLTLKLDLVNAKNTLENSKISLKRANSALANFLGLDQDTEIEVEMPQVPTAKSISLDDAIIYAKSNSYLILEQKQNVLEAQKTVNKTKIENLFSASLNMSVGYNQVGEHFHDAYTNLLRQDLVSLTLSIPLVDWGVRKGKYNMAVSNLEVAKTAEHQEIQKLVEEVSNTVEDFNIQSDLIRSATEAMDLADMAYDQTQRRFMIGKADISSMTLASSRRQEATKNYIESLKNYWLSYYKIRKLTLFDFELCSPLSRTFDIANQVR